MILLAGDTYRYLSVEESATEHSRDDCYHHSVTLKMATDLSKLLQCSHMQLFHRPHSGAVC